MNQEQYFEYNEASRYFVLTNSLPHSRKLVFWYGPICGPQIDVKLECKLNLNLQNRHIWNVSRRIKDRIRIWKICGLSKHNMYMSRVIFTVHRYQISKTCYPKTIYYCIMYCKYGYIQ